MSETGSPSQRALLPLSAANAEAARLRTIIGGLPRRGACLLVRGDAGVGKTSLVALALHEARQQGSAIVASSSVQSEAELAFAGLHLLIQPLLDDLDRLPAGQRRALLAAFGMIDAPTPDRFLIALGTLELLANAARRQLQSTLTRAAAAFGPAVEGRNLTVVATPERSWSCQCHPIAVPGNRREPCR